MPTKRPPLTTRELADLPADHYVRIRDVVSVTSLSRSTIWRRVKAGQFPAPFRLGPPGTQVVAWHVGDIRQWLDSLEPVTV